MFSRSVADSSTFRVRSNQLKACLAISPASPTSSVHLLPNLAHCLCLCASLQSPADVEHFVRYAAAWYQYVDKHGFKIPGAVINWMLLQGAIFSTASTVPTVNSNAVLQVYTDVTAFNTTEQTKVTFEFLTCWCQQQFVMLQPQIALAN